jgi:hypothetical protein
MTADPCVQIVGIGRQMKAELRGGLAASDPEIPLMTRANGTLMARRRWAVSVLTCSLSDPLEVARSDRSAPAAVEADGDRFPACKICADHRGICIDAAVGRLAVALTDRQ